MIKYLATASLLLAGAYLSTGTALTADPGITDTEIVIGDVEPLTGPPALLGVAASIGHKIAIAEANAAGGINGRKIKYVLEDDGYVTARSIQGVKKVIDVDKAFALLGISGSGQSIAVMPLPQGDRQTRSKSSPRAQISAGDPRAEHNQDRTQGQGR